MKNPVVLTPDQVTEKVRAANELAAELLKLAHKQPKAYVGALGCYLACASICREFGWDPRDFFQWVAHSFPKEPPT